MFETFQMIHQCCSNIHAKSEIGADSAVNWPPSGGCGFFLAMTVDIP